MFLSIVVPAYNEEKRIGATLKAYIKFFAKKDVEFIIVLNNCTDRTIDVVQPFKKQNPKLIRLLDINEAIGKGGAVREGFKLARGKLVGFVDADGSTSPQEYNKIIEQVGTFDGAIASRWKPGSEVINRKWFRKVISLGFILVVRILFWFPYYDTQCGAKVFKSKVIKTVTPKLRVTNMAFDVELLHKISKAGYTVTEVPTTWVDSSSSALLGSPFKIAFNSFKIFFTLIQIRFNM